MEITNIIHELKTLDLVAECSNCGEEFKLSKSIIFDALGKFPDIAEERRKALMAELQERIVQLKKRKISADVGAEKKAIEVGLGKILEKVVPAYKEFKMNPTDCRLLYEPIDMIVFNGISNRKMDSVSFLEIKSGNSQLNKHQRLVRNAVLEEKVNFKVV